MKISLMKISLGSYGRVEVRYRAPRDIATIEGDSARDWESQQTDLTIELDGIVVACAPRKDALAQALAIPEVAREIAERNGKAEWVLRVQHQGAGWTELGWGVCPTGERAKDALAQAKKVGPAPKYKQHKAPGFRFAFPAKQGTGKLREIALAPYELDWGWGSLSGPSDGCQIVRGPGEPFRKVEVEPLACEIPRTLSALLALHTHLVFTRGRCVLVDNRVEALRGGPAWPTASAPARYDPACEGLVFFAPPWDSGGYLVGRLNSELYALIAPGIGYSTTNMGEDGIRAYAREGACD